MLPINTDIVFRTCGRGVLRTWKGTIKHIIPAGRLPKTNALQAAVPHGHKPSNRDRYIVALAKTEALMWANANTCVQVGEKLPPHNPRLGQHQEKKITKAKAKPKVKAKPTLNKLLKKVAKLPKERKEALAKDLITEAAKIVKRKGGDKPKTTWYGLVNGEVVSVRKVLCPPGFKANKAEILITPAPETPFQSEPQATPAAASLPQASL